MLDATFSGGPHDVLAGALTLMIGGEPETVEHARPLLQTYADKIFYIGPLGYGQMLKLLNNLSFAANLKNVAELLQLAEGLNFKASDVANIIQNCSGGGQSVHAALYWFITVSDCAWTSASVTS